MYDIIKVKCKHRYNINCLDFKDEVGWKKDCSDYLKPLNINFTCEYMEVDWVTYITKFKHFEKI